MNVNPRTCIGCRRAVERHELVRLVWSEGSAAVMVDERAVLPGRGAWIHPDEVCIALALKRRAVGRALRRSVDPDQVARALAAAEASD